MQRKPSRALLKRTMESLEKIATYFDSCGEDWWEFAGVMKEAAEELESLLAWLNMEEGYWPAPTTQADGKSDEYHSRWQER